MYLMEGSVARLTRTDLTANVAPSGAGARVVRSATLVVVGGVVARNNATARRRRRHSLRRRRGDARERARGGEHV